MRGERLRAWAGTRRWWIVGALLTLALALRLGLLIATPGYIPVSDAEDYERHAISIAGGGGYPAAELRGAGPSALRAPLYPYALGLVYAVVGEDAVARRHTARALQAVAGTALVGLIGLLAHRLLGWGTALIAMAIAAAHPSMAAWETALLSETAFAVITTAAAVALLQHRRTGRWPWLALTGVLGGLAALSRPNGLAVPLALAAAAMLLRRRDPRPREEGRPLSRSLGAPALILATSALVVSPWTIRNARQFNEFIPVSTGLGYALHGTYNPLARTVPGCPACWQPNVPLVIGLVVRHGDAEASDRLTGQAVRYIQRNPAYLLEVGFWSTLRLTGLAGPGFERRAFIDIGRGSPWEALAVMSWAGLVTVGAVAVLALTRRRVRRAFVGVWVVPVLLLLAPLFVWGTTRYRFPAEPFVIVLAAGGIADLLGATGRGGTNERRGVRAGVEAGPA